ncbi:uncharacterized protein BDR25DRAFT_262445 [Lindgomyces ingoldianus]|uniref:Uncharacterized protein n=1 Tax=Lindgomyces ingoldianus TaxID=673940 RepID=A0ACB6QU98_9PLEO|nr:uncharacterized protein BDR25DRAFT_262445 [Lindgomyces ingoldianus]KAF2470506.1 hypothetical protein BDR25DRAFT_262445 [Lindgomyces ingoldianus]
MAAERLRALRLRSIPPTTPSPALNPPQVTEDQQTIGKNTSPMTEDPFVPSYADVRVVRAMLARLYLPLELVLDILERARYWPEESFHSERAVTVEGRWGSRVYDAKICVLAHVFGENMKKMLGGEKEENVKIREVEFEMQSHDQGWTSAGTAGTFNTSSWFETLILRDGAGVAGATPPVPMSNCRSTEFQRSLEGTGWDIIPRPSTVPGGPAQDDDGGLTWYLQGNRVAHHHRTTYKVVWGESRFEGNEGAGGGEGFLESLKEGDWIAVIARAKYPGWSNDAASVKVTVRYGF